MTRVQTCRGNATARRGEPPHGRHALPDAGIVGVIGTGYHEQCSQVNRVTPDLETSLPDEKKLT